jgi:DNA-binding SARP family transcriptional activator/predicted ATPase
MALAIQLFGTPRFSQDDGSLNLGRRKSVALLAYVAVTHQPQSRDVLATLLWPESEQVTARMNLRRDLSWLRQRLSDEVLLIERSQIAFNEAANVQLDVLQFEAGLAFVQSHAHSSDDSCAQCAHVLMETVELYQGEFLSGFSLPDSTDFEEWLFFQREKWRRETAVALQKLVEWCSAQKMFERGVDYGRRWLALDPWHEPAHRALMKLYAWSGHQSAALRQYEECVRLLETELGIEPEAETTELYEAIRTKHFEKSADNAEVPTASARQTTIDESHSLPLFLQDEGTPRPAPVFVARERELSDLEAALDSARAGQGQILFIIGGAGRGKTVLVQGFARRAQDVQADLIVITGHCDAMTGVGDPYLPFREALTMLTGDVEARWAGGLMSQSQARRLWELMPLTLPALVTHAPDLIGNFVPTTALHTRATAAAAPQAAWWPQLMNLVTAEHKTGLEQQRIFSQYTALLKAIAAQRPLLFIIEDLHWVDTASSGLLFHLSREIGDSPILIVGTYRPEEVTSLHDVKHPLANLVSELKRQHGDIWLDLDDPTAVEGRQFVEAYLDTQSNKLDATFREALFHHTGGYALFTAELLRDMIERGDLVRDEEGCWITADTIDWQTLPVKVEGVIEKRIQRLDKEWQDVLTLASVEGEIFTAEVVARIQGLDEIKLVRQLSSELDKQHRLVTAQTLERLGQQRLSRYRFRHNLFQHYLYYSLDEMERGYLHEAVGNVLESLYGERTEEIAVQLAWHFQEAGLVAKASHYLQTAGNVAARVYAHNEAIAAYRQALALIKKYKVEDENLIHLYSRLGRTLELNSQFNEALALYEEMADVARQQGNRPMELAALMPQMTLYVTPTAVHDSTKGIALGQAALTLVRELGDQAAEVKTLWNLSLGGMWGGRTSEGITYGEEAVTLARQLNLIEPLAQALNDLGLLHLAVLNLERAKQVLYEAGNLWRELDNLPMLLDSMSMTSNAHIFAGEYQQAMALSDEAFQISASTNNLWGQSFSRLLVCWAYWESGWPDQALAMANETVRLGKLAGFLASEVLGGGNLAAIYGNLGALEQGKEVARQAVLAAETHFPYFRCHPLGILAHLHLLSGNLAEATAVVEEGRNDPYAAAHPAWVIRLYMAEVKLAFQQGDFERTITLADHWLTQLRQNKMQGYILPFLHLWSEAHLSLGHMETARDVPIWKRACAAESAGKGGHAHTAHR